MQFNSRFLLQFLGGIACFYAAYRIFYAGNSGGFFVKAVGVEAQIKAFLFGGLGIYLCLLPFRVPNNIVLKWKDVFLMLGLMLSTEPIAYLLAKFFH